MAEEAKVRYVGKADRRRISAKSWKTAGVEGQTQVEWNRQNDFSVPKKNLNADALKKLERDKNFVVG